MCSKYPHPVLSRKETPPQAQSPHWLCCKDVNLAQTEVWSWPSASRRQTLNRCDAVPDKTLCLGVLGQGDSNDVIGAVGSSGSHSICKPPKWLETGHLPMFMWLSPNEKNPEHWVRLGELPWLATLFVRSHMDAGEVMLSATPQRENSGSSMFRIFADLPSVPLLLADYILYPFPVVNRLRA